MKTATLTAEQAADIIIAESFGSDAFNNGSAKAPFQCKQLAPMLRKHNGPIGNIQDDLHIMFHDDHRNVSQFGNVKYEAGHIFSFFKIHSCHGLIQQ